MIDLSKRAYMLFDGDCGICTWFADFAMRTDKQRLFYIEPYQQFSETELVPFGITHSHCARRMQVISPRGKVYSGAFALNYFFFHYFPWSLAVLLCYLVPVLLLFEVLGYALIARSRHRLSRWLRMRACLPHNDIHLSG
jgi:predicted DCC family thiol-disulfide oxidoreductase YuxK